MGTTRPIALHLCVLLCLAAWSAATVMLISTTCLPIPVCSMLHAICPIQTMVDVVLLALVKEPSLKSTMHRSPSQLKAQTLLDSVAGYSCQQTFTLQPMVLLSTRLVLQGSGVQ